MEYRDRSLILAAIGVLLLSVGIVAAFLGPAEMYCFYLFSEGGVFTTRVLALVLSCLAISLPKSWVIT